MFYFWSPPTPLSLLRTVYVCGGVCKCNCIELREHWALYKSLHSFETSLIVSGTLEAGVQEASRDHFVSASFSTRVMHMVMSSF